MSLDADFHGFRSARSGLRFTRGYILAPRPGLKANRK
jgi:hypothetical protein